MPKVSRGIERCYTIDLELMLPVLLNTAMLLPCCLAIRSVAKRHHGIVMDWARLHLEQALERRACEDSEKSRE
jgi:hypothetical protein